MNYSAEVLNVYFFKSRQRIQWLFFKSLRIIPSVKDSNNSGFIFVCVYVFLKIYKRLTLYSKSKHVHIEKGENTLTFIKKYYNYFNIIYLWECDIGNHIFLLKMSNIWIFKDTFQIIRFLSTIYNKFRRKIVLYDFWFSLKSK